MTAKDHPLDARVQLIRDNMSKIVAGINAAVDAERIPTTKETADAIMGVISLAELTIVTLTEIAYSVGRIADQGDANIQAAAEIRADELNNEKTKRNFIGQPRK